MSISLCKVNNDMWHAKCKVKHLNNILVNSLQPIHIMFSIGIMLNHPYHVKRPHFVCQNPSIFIFPISLHLLSSPAEFLNPDFSNFQDYYDIDLLKKNYVIVNPASSKNLLKKIVLLLSRPQVQIY